MDPLTEQMLHLERQFWKTAGAKENAIRELGLSPTRYYQLLNQWIDTPEAIQADPVLVKRLLRLSRTSRRR